MLFFDSAKLNILYTGAEKCLDGSSKVKGHELHSYCTHTGGRGTRCGIVRRLLLPLPILDFFDILRARVQDLAIGDRGHRPRERRLQEKHADICAAVVDGREVRSEREGRKVIWSRVKGPTHADAELRPDSSRDATSYRSDLQPARAPRPCVNLEGAFPLNQHSRAQLHHHHRPTRTSTFSPAPSPVLATLRNSRRRPSGGVESIFAMADITIDKNSFHDRLSSFLSQWKNDKRSGDGIFGGVSSIVIMVGKANDAAAYPKNVAFQVRASHCSRETLQGADCRLCSSGCSATSSRPLFSSSLLMQFTLSLQRRRVRLATASGTHLG